MEILKNPVFISQLLMSLFLAIVFLQSSLDKIFNWSGNLSWIKDHFSKSFLANSVTPMLAVLTIAELATGLLALCGACCILFCEDNRCTYYALVLSLVSYLMLLFGQRVVQDYEGAKTIVIYFSASLIGLMLYL